MPQLCSFKKSTKHNRYIRTREIEYLFHKIKRAFMLWIVIMHLKINKYIYSWFVVSYFFKNYCVAVSYLYTYMNPYPLCPCFLVGRSCWRMAAVHSVIETSIMAVHSVSMVKFYLSSSFIGGLFITLPICLFHIQGFDTCKLLWLITELEWENTLFLVSHHFSALSHLSLCF